MNERQRKERLKRMNKKEDKKISSNNAKQDINSNDFKIRHPIRFKEHIINLTIFSLISIIIVPSEKYYDFVALSQLVKALNEHSAPNSIAILLTLWVFLATVYRYFYDGKPEVGLSNMAVFSPLNFAFNLAAVWIPISLINNYFNDTRLLWNEIILITTAYISLALLYNTEEYEESSSEMRICGCFPLVIFYSAFLGTLIYRFLSL